MKFFILTALIFLISCKDSKEREYYESGELKKVYELFKNVKHGSEKEFYKSGNIKTIANYQNGKPVDTIFSFYDVKERVLKSQFLIDGELVRYFKNDSIFSEGYIKNENRVGQWKFYTKDGNLNEIRDYKIIEGKSFLNQNRFLPKDSEGFFNVKNEKINPYRESVFEGDTLLTNKSNYSEFDLGKDTIRLNEPWRAVCFYYTPVFKDQNSETIVVLSRDDDSFNDDFSNILEVKRDTFFSLKKDVDNRKHFPDDDADHTVVFGRWFKTPGEKTIRGYLSEYYTDNTNGVKVVQKKMFFEKKIFVKDSVR